MSLVVLSRVAQYLPELWRQIAGHAQEAQISGMYAIHTAQVKIATLQATAIDEKKRLITLGTAFLNQLALVSDTGEPLFAPFGFKPLLGEARF